MMVEGWVRCQCDVVLCTKHQEGVHHYDGASSSNRTKIFSCDLSIEAEGWECGRPAGVPWFEQNLSPLLRYTTGGEVRHNGLHGAGCRLPDQRLHVSGNSGSNRCQLCRQLASQWSLSWLAHAISSSLMIFPSDYLTFFWKSCTARSYLNPAFVTMTFHFFSSSSLVRFEYNHICIACCFTQSWN